MENTLANVDLGRYRRIVQMFWDPEPINDTAADQPVWCLGRSYRLADGKISKNVESPTSTAPPLQHEQPSTGGLRDSDSVLLEKEPESTPSSFSSSLAYGETAPDSSWPQAFVDDFEARFWMTYRSDFETIPRSSDPKALSTMSLSMRIKNQLGDQAGFSSDSGWGCMIRSGQSLLANAIALQRFGRGMQ